MMRTIDQNALQDADHRRAYRELAKDMDDQRLCDVVGKVAANLGHQGNTGSSEAVYELLRRYGKLYHMEGTK